MEANYFTILYWFCHTSTLIHHRCTRVPHPEPSSHLPPHTIPLGHPSAPAPSILYPALNLDWRFISYMILYMFQCHSPKSSHPLPLPQSPKDCPIHLCLFCCLRVVMAHWSWAPCLMHQTWTGIATMQNSVETQQFHCWAYTSHFTCNIHGSMLFSQIIPASASVRESKRTVAYLSVSFAVSHTGLSLPSF